MSNEGTMTDVPTDSSSWRQRALDRSLRDARAKAVNRSDRFIAAAVALMRETGRNDFTVQQLVERSGMSLRSFYQYFGGKDELLLALFEENLRVATSAWSQGIAHLDDPVEKLRTVVEAVLSESSINDSSSSVVRALALYHVQMADSRPEQFEGLVAPLRGLLLDLCREGADAGRLRRDLEPEVLSVLVLQSVMASAILGALNVQTGALSAAREHLWTFVLSGLGVPSSQPAN